MTEKELSQQAKEYLSQIYKTDRLIQRLTDTVVTLRSSLTSQSYELKPDKVQSSGAMNPLESAIIKIADLEAQINARIDELIALKQEVFTKISKIPDLDQQNVLIARYIQNQSWENIAAQFNRKVRWVYRVHKAAIMQFWTVNNMYRY